MHNVTGRAGVLRGLAGPQNTKNRGGTPLPVACSPSTCRLRSWGKIEPYVLEAEQYMICWDGPNVGRWCNCIYTIDCRGNIHVDLGAKLYIKVVLVQGFLSESIMGQIGNCPGKV